MMELSYGEKQMAAVLANPRIDGMVLKDPVYGSWEARLLPLPQKGCNCYSTADGAIMELRAMGCKEILVMFLPGDGSRDLREDAAIPALSAT